MSIESAKGPFAAVITELSCLAFRAIRDVIDFFEAEPTRKRAHFVFPEGLGRRAHIITVQHLKSGLKLTVYEIDDATASIVVPVIREILERCKWGPRRPKVSTDDLARFVVHPYSATPRALCAKFAGEPPPFGMFWDPGTGLSTRFSDALVRLSARADTNLPMFAATFGHVQLRAIKADMLKAPEGAGGARGK